MRRRSVLKGLGAGGVLVAGAGLLGWRLLDDDPTDAPASLSEAVLAVGRRYLEKFPEEGDRAVLFDALPTLAGQVPDRPEEALAALRTQVVDDYTAGETVSLDGWVLSRTECRASALYAL